MDRGAYDEIAEQLRGLLTRFDDRLSARDAALISEFIDAGELGLALEYIADLLSDGGQRVAEDERADMLALVERMQMSERVGRALATCPVD